MRFADPFNATVFDLLDRFNPELSESLPLSGGPGCIAALGEYRRTKKMGL